MAQRKTKAGKPAPTVKPRKVSKQAAEPEKDPRAWLEGSAASVDPDQRAHSVLWSAFLGIQEKDDAEVFSKRYLPYESAAVAAFLRQQFDLERLQRQAATLRALSGNCLLELGLWALAPHFDRIDKEAVFDRGGSRGDVAQLRKEFQKAFGVPTEALSAVDDDRPLIPSLHGIAIERPSITTTATRTSMCARLDTVVRKPLRLLQDTVYPWNWGASPFWVTLPEKRVVHESLLDETFNVDVRLPGGSWVTASKKRNIEMKAVVVRSPFSSQIDYECRETAGNGSVKEVLTLQGYLFIEKQRARPDCCHVEAERTVSFNDVTHQLFARQTLWYWLASELISIAHAAGRDS